MIKNSGQIHPPLSSASSASDEEQESTALSEIGARFHPRARRVKGLRMRRFGMAIASALACVSVPTSARAFDFTDPQGDLHAPLDPVAGEKLCVAVPTGHVDAAACAGYRTEAIAKMSPPSPEVSIVGVAMLRDSVDQPVLFVLERGARGHATTHLEESGDALAAGMEKGMKERLGAGVKTLRNEHSVRNVAGRDALFVDVDLDIPPGSPARTISGHARFIQFPSDDFDYTLSFSGPFDNATEINSVADRVISRLTAKRPLVSPTSKRDGVEGDDRDALRPSRDDVAPVEPSDKAFRLGERIGFIIGMIGFPALVILALVLLLRKKPTPQQYGHPYYGPGQWPPPQQGQWPGNPYGQQPPANPYQGQGQSPPPPNQPPPGWTPPGGA